MSQIKHLMPQIVLNQELFDQRQSKDEDEFSQNLEASCRYLVLWTDFGWYQKGIKVQCQALISTCF